MSITLKNIRSLILKMRISEANFLDLNYEAENVFSKYNDQIFSGILTN